MEGTGREGSLGVVSTILRDKEADGGGEESYPLLIGMTDRNAWSEWRHGGGCADSVRRAQET